MLLALDLFCGGGGACIGMQQAGFEVVGIDLTFQRHYPGHFIQADALNPPVDLSEFDFIWASPPCQRFSQGILCAKNKDKYKDYPDLIKLTRTLLEKYNLTCIENVPRAPIRKDLELTGPSVCLENLQRRRYFELSFEAEQPIAPNLSRKKWDSGEAVTIWTGMVATNESQRKRCKRLGIPLRISKQKGKSVMGIPEDYEFTNKQIGNAVPPPYSKYVVEQAKHYLF